MELLSVSSYERSGWRVLAASGQLDVATAPGFRQTLLEAQYGGGTRVALDLSELEFLDSFGLGVVVGGVKRARVHDGELAVVCPVGRIRHVFEITGVERLLPLVDHLSDLDHLEPFDRPEQPEHVEAPGRGGEAQGRGDDDRRGDGPVR